jgi:hypothetical protein
MTKLISIVALLFIVLPALIAAGGHNSQATKCKLSVTTKLTDSSNRVYTGTINNIGTVAAADVLVTASDDVRSVSGLSQTNNGGYALAASQVSAGGIAAGSSYTFTYTASRNSNIRWSSSCTDAVTSDPTKTPTTKAATTAPTTKGKAATTAPTSKGKAATTAPTSKPATTAPTTKGKTATTAPTKAATSSGSSVGTSAPSTGRVCPTGSWWAPAPETTWQWQLTGTIDQTVNVQMYDIDLFDATASLISSLHSKGRVVICYFSTQYENWRPDASSFTSAVKGNGLDGWAGENYVDIRSTVVRNIMSSRLDLAVSKGCDGVEPDNVDGYEASTGFPLTSADQISFNSFIAAQAHARGLSVGLKNDIDQATALQPYFDWALNEQCNEYSECSSLNVFITAGKAVFNAEYSGSASSVCPKMVTSKFSSLIKDLDLTASIKAECCTYQSNGCAAVPYRCISSM